MIAGARLGQNIKERVRIGHHDPAEGGHATGKKASGSMLAVGPTTKTSACGRARASKPSKVAVDQRGPGNDNEIGLGDLCAAISCGT